MLVARRAYQEAKTREQESVVAFLPRFPTRPRIDIG